MKPRFNFIVCILTCFICKNTNAQTKLAIGDQVPNLKTNQVVNFDSGNFQVSNYQGKLLILDFWATWCSPCVAMLPKTDSLNKVFKGNLEIVPVSQQNFKTVDNFLKKMKLQKKVSISSVFNDTILNNLLPHSSIPFYAWIDQSGKLIATTEAAEINEQKIRDVINGYTGKLTSVRGQENRNLNLHKQVFLPAIPFLNKKGDSTNMQAVQSQDILYQSVLTRYIPNVSSRQSWDSIHFVATNNSLINFYKTYYGLSHYSYYTMAFWSKSRFRIELTDTVLANKVSSPKIGQQYVSWLKENGFSFELIWKNGKTWKDKFDMLKFNLDTYLAIPLGIQVLIEKRLAPSDVLVLNDNGNRLKSKGGEPKESYDVYSYKLYNMPLQRLVERLQSYYWQKSDRAIFDETNFKSNVDIELKCNMNDFNAVNKELEKYGLTLKDEKRLTDVMVVKNR